jgi:dolichol kinase
MRFRKLVHLCGAAFAVIALYDVYVALGLVVLGMAAFLLLEALKSRLDKALLLTLYREGELKSCAMEPLLFLAAIGCLLLVSIFFVPKACYGAIIVLTIGDGFASVIGRALGKTKLPFSEKTWAGSLSGFVLSTLIGFLIAGPAIIVGAAAGMAVEAYSKKYENFIIAAVAFLSMAAFAIASA